jgi:hypothetical protein
VSKVANSDTRPRPTTGAERLAGQHTQGLVQHGEKQIGGSGGLLEPPGPLLDPPGHLLAHLHTVCMACSERLPTGLNPLAERTCFSQVQQPARRGRGRGPAARVLPGAAGRRRDAAGVSLAHLAAGDAVVSAESDRHASKITA